MVGPGRVEYTYRDSGLALDGASELVVAGAPDLLAPGGVATLLASWVHTRDADWRSRVASWLPDHGIDAWVVQRDVADPALYVGTWLRDSGLDPRDPAAQRRAEHWLDTLDEAELTGIGFGFVFLRRIDGPTEVLAEDLSHGFDDPLGPEVMQYFARSAWLRDHDLRHARLRRAPDIALEQISTPTVDGWRQIGARLHRSDGPRWRHDIDDLLSALLAGLRPDGLPLGELVDLLSRGHLGGPATPEFE
ncbi:MAG: SAM-dependent methyltransferase, partial [Acidimicrobiia bacterium]